MSTLTMADVAEYFSAYKAKYNEPLTLSLDSVEQVLMGTEEDDLEIILPALHDAMQPDETETETNDRLPVERDERPGSAYSYAVKMDATFERDLETFAQAALENKRGGAVIMLDLFRNYGQETIEAVWPKPGSYKPGQGHLDTEAGSNEPWDKEDTSITKVDGTTGKGTKSFYQELVDLSPKGNALLAERTELKKVVGDVKGVKPKLSLVESKRTSYKSAIIRAVNLAQKMAFCNAKTGLQCEVVMDVDDNGNNIVAYGTKLIFIKSKTDQTKFDVITIGQFLALKVSEGATFLQITGTTQRKPRAAAAPMEVNINSSGDFDVVTAAYATFIDRIEEAMNKKDMKPYNGLLTHLNSDNSTDLLLSMNKIVNFFEPLLSKPGISTRLAKALGDEKTTKAA